MTSPCMICGQPVEIEDTAGLDCIDGVYMVVCGDPAHETLEPIDEDELRGQL